jgi:hypothetical protein
MIMRRDFASLSLLLAFTLVNPASGAPVEVSLEDFVPNRSIADPLLSENGVWQTKTQQVFDPVLRTLLRRQYMVWNPDPSRNLDFVWIPDSPADDKDGKIAGKGRLIWRTKGAPAYDPTAIFSEFRGALVEGRPSGAGEYKDSSGFAYSGGWKNGSMDGYGSLRLPNGDEYAGQFKNGQANGTGKYVNIFGETFDGTFSNGLRHGRGTTTLPSGLSYQSIWISGEESEGTRAIRFSQTGGQQVPSRSDEVGVSVELIEREDYVTTSIGPRLSISPNSELMGMWKGDTDATSAASLKYTGGPLNFRIGVQNRSTRNLQVVGVYLDVQSSATDPQPAITADIARRNPCGTPLYGPQIILNNYGWGVAEDAILRVAFASSSDTAGRATPAITKPVGRIDRMVRVDLEPDLSAAGVNTGLLRSRANGVLVCRSNNPKVCLRELKSSRTFGSLAELIVDESDLSVSAIGDLEYVWTDERGVKKTRTSKIKADINLGHLQPPNSACAEEAAPEVPLPQPLVFRLDQSQYRLPVLVTPRPLPAGRTYSLRFRVIAAKSSRHEFRMVAQMADGSEVASRAIQLLYLKSNDPGPP